MCLEGRQDHCSNRSVLEYLLATMLILQPVIDLPRPEVKTEFTLVYTSRGYNQVVGRTSCLLQDFPFTPPAAYQMGKENNIFPRTSKVSPILVVPFLYRHSGTIKSCSLYPCIC